MKHSMLLRFIFILTAFGMLPAQSVFAEHVTSLRGEMDLDIQSTAPELKRYYKDEEPIARDYLQQPPLIPHKTQQYKITIKHNKCLSCHSWKNYKKKGATKISQTHFENRDGAVMANVSGGRYFCTQCHVPQVNAKPLVENTFQPVEVMQH